MQLPSRSCQSANTEKIFSILQAEIWDGTTGSDGLMHRAPPLGWLPSRRSVAALCQSLQRRNGQPHGPIGGTLNLNSHSPAIHILNSRSRAEGNRGDARPRVARRCARGQVMDAPGRADHVCDRCYSIYLLNVAVYAYNPCEM